MQRRASRQSKQTEVGALHTAKHMLIQDPSRSLAKDAAVRMLRPMLTNIRRGSMSSTQRAPIMAMTHQRTAYKCHLKQQCTVATVGP